MADAYAAGILDGEGSIGIFNQDGYYVLRVKVAMTDKGDSVLRYLKEMHGGSISSMRPERGNARSSREWRVNGPEALTFLKNTYQFLRVKRVQAEIAFQLGDLIASAPVLPNGKKEWSDAMRSTAQVLKMRMNEANQRGTQAAFASTPHPKAIAVFQYGEWMEPEPDLFGPVAFRGAFPTSGSMRDGSILPVPD